LDVSYVNMPHDGGFSRRHALRDWGLTRLSLQIRTSEEKSTSQEKSEQKMSG
jgi:hypothetical protein